MRSRRPPVCCSVSAAGIGETIRFLQIGSPPAGPLLEVWRLAPIVIVPVNGTVAAPLVAVPATTRISVRSSARVDVAAGQPDLADERRRLGDAEGRRGKPLRRRAQQIDVERRRLLGHVGAGEVAAGRLPARDRLALVEVDGADVELRLRQRHVPAEVGRERERLAGHRVRRTRGGDRERDAVAAGLADAAGEREGQQRRGAEARITPLRS